MSEEQKMFPLNNFNCKVYNNKFFLTYSIFNFFIFILYYFYLLNLNLMNFSSLYLIYQNFEEEIPF